MDGNDWRDDLRAIINNDVLRAMDGQMGSDEAMLRLLGDNIVKALGLVLDAWVACGEEGHRKMTLPILCDHMERETCSHVAMGRKVFVLDGKGMGHWVCMDHFLNL